MIGIIAEATSSYLIATTKQHDDDCALCHCYSILGQSFRNVKQIKIALFYYEKDIVKPSNPTVQVFRSRSCTCMWAHVHRDCRFDDLVMFFG